MWLKKEIDEQKKSYLDDGPGPSKDIVHLKACKIYELRVTIMKENLKKLKYSWDDGN